MHFMASIYVSYFAVIFLTLCHFKLSSNVPIQCCILFLKNFKTLYADDGKLNLDEMES